MALPGVRTVLKDRFYSLTRTDVPDGPRVVGIAPRGTDAAAGTTPTGSSVARWPSLDAYTPASSRDVIHHFGEGSPVHRQYEELVSGGAARVTLVALDADATLDVALLGEAFDVAETARPSIVVPWGRGWHWGDTDEAPMIENPDWTGPNDPDAEGDPQFIPDPAYTDITPPPVGFAANNAATAANSFAAEAARKAREITNRSFPCFAVLGLSPTPTSGDNAPSGAVLPSEFDAYVPADGTITNLVDRDTDEMKNLGPYVSVVGTELEPVGYPSGSGVNVPSPWGFSNGASMYAGLVSGLDSWNAATGKTVYGIRNMRYNPTRVQQQNLINKGVVPVTLNFSRVPTWVDGLTFATASSDYTRLSTLRIVMETLQRIRTGVEIYVGQPATLTHRHAMETTVTAVLREMTLQGAILSSDFVINYAPRENTARIDLVIEPAFEMRTIEVSISVRL